jgi:hypothetical protein
MIVLFRFVQDVSAYGRFRACDVRIPTKPAMHSDRNPATDFQPLGNFRRTSQYVWMSGTFVNIVTVDKCKYVGSQVELLEKDWTHFKRRCHRDRPAPKCNLVCSGSTHSRDFSRGPRALCNEVLTTGTPPAAYSSILLAALAPGKTLLASRIPLPRGGRVSSAGRDSGLILHSSQIGAFGRSPRGIIWSTSLPGAVIRNSVMRP